MKKKFTGKEIKIIYNDKYTIAIDLKTGKKGIARCNPVDKFDEITGAKIAISRLRKKSNEVAIGDILASKSSDVCGPVVYIFKEKTPEGYTQCVIDCDGWLHPMLYPFPDTELIGDKFHGDVKEGAVRSL